METARTILKPFVVLGLIIGLVLINDAITSIRIDFGRSGTPYNTDRISGVTLTGGGKLGPTIYIPADNFRCLGYGQLNCGGEISGERLSFAVVFNGGWSCNATYEGRPITCQGAFGGGDIRTAHVNISKAELNLSDEELSSPDLHSIVSTNKPIRSVWLLIGTLFALEMLRRIYGLTRWSKKHEGSNGRKDESATGHAQR